MRNLFNKATGTAIAIAAAALLSSGSALATEHVDPPAVVMIDGVVCVVFDRAGNIFVLDPPPDGDAVAQTVVTPSGNLKATCAGTIPADEFPILPTRGADVFTTDDNPFEVGLECFVNPIGLQTVDWHMVVTKSGKVSLSCHDNGQP